MPPTQNLSEEADRLSALHQLQLLDTAPQQEFDDLVRLASVLCATPVAMITLIDADRQWVKAKTGVDVCETPRGISFCTHAIRQTSLFVVPDLARDPRFADNPLVTGEPHVRFYAGVPLVTAEGHALGTLCVLDVVPRELTPAQTEALEALGRQAAALLDLRRNMLRCERNMVERAAVQAELRVSEERLRLALASVGMAIWDWDTRDDTFMCSADFAPVFGHRAGEWEPTGEDIFAATHPDDRAKAAAALEGARSDGMGYSIEMRVFWPDGSLHWLASTTEVHRDGEGRPVRLVGVVQDITARKEAEDAVCASQEMQKLIMDTIPHLIFWKDTRSVYLGCNQKFAHVAGLDGPDDIVGRDDYGMPWTTEEADGFRADDREVIESDTPKLHIIEAQHRADGRHIWAETNKVPIHDVHGAVVGVLGTYEDITYRLESEDALRRSEQLLRTVVTGAPVILFALDLDGVFTLSEGKGLEELGLRPGEAVGVCAFDIYRDNPEAIADLQRALTGEAFNCVSRIGDLTFDNWYSPIRDAQGAVTGMVGVSCDISQRAQAERELRGSEARFNAFMDNSPALTYVKDDVGRYVYANRTFERAYDLTPEQYLGSTALDIMAPEFGSRLHQETLDALAQEGASESRISVPTVEGECDWHVHRFTFRDGQDRKFLGCVAFDVTEQKRAEQKVWEALHQREEAWIYAEHQTELLQGQTVELLETRDQALASTRAKSDFLANMSHEIRTPMNGILGMAALLARTPLTPQQQHYARTIQHSADSLLTIINDILDFSKIEAGKMTIEAVPFDLREAMEETVDLLAPRAEEKGLALACVLPPSFPNYLEGDGVRIRQILTNLVGNAVKFTPAGEVVLEARLLDETPSHAHFRLSVRDTGVGIPPERQADVFDSFTQADGGVTRRFGGTGLGLTICRQLVTLMGGEIGVESEPGRGSTFWVTLTLPKDAAAPEKAASSALTGLRVLVMDAQAASREAICTQLRSWGCRAEQAVDGLDCLEALVRGTIGAESFGLALLDARTLQAAGAGLADRITQNVRRSGIHTTLIGCAAPPEDLSGYDMTCLNKPVRQSSLYNALLSCVGPALVPGEPPPAAPGAAPLAGMRVLLAEDNEINQEVAVATLETWGCRVDVAGNGREALVALSKGHYDAVLMDVQMPEMDGLEATAQIRRDERGTGRRQPIIAMTAHNMRGDRENCLACGMDDYTAKPIDAAQLLAALERWRPAVGDAPATPAFVDAPATPAALEAPPAAPPPLSVTADVAPAATPEAPPAIPPGGPAPGDAPVLDFDSLHRVCGGKVSLERRIMGEFLRLLPPILERIHAAARSGDAGQVRFEAHTLKGSGRTLGATALADACAVLEDAAKLGDLSGADGQVARIDAEAARLRPVLEATLEDDHWKAAA